MPKTSRRTEYDIFKKFCNEIDAGKNPYFTTDKYVVISRTAWDNSVENIKRAMEMQKHVYNQKPS